MADNGPRVFISYRRSDRALAAHWVHREVAARFGKDAVFFDVDGIPAGFDYREFLQEKVSQCDVLLAVIGDDWLDVRDAADQRRLENVNDFVRIEIEAALKRKIPVIPVLVENARMPVARELPTGLHELAYRQAREVRSGHHLDDHFRRLNESIETAWRIHNERLQRPPIAEEDAQVPRDSQAVKKKSAPREKLRSGDTVATSAGPSQSKSQPGSAGNIITNSIGMKLAAIPAGRFQMGSPNNEPGRWDSEGPQHKVELTRGFHLGVYPVTQAEYEQVVGSNPSHFTGDGRRPVEQVSWFDAVTFCNRLSEREQLSPFYDIKGQQVRIGGGRGYRLPAEAEWEYACRAGTTSRWWFGDDESRLSEFAWYGENSGSTTHPVGEKPANPWGLNDIHGNVWEWCQDWYDAYASGRVIDPPGPDSGTGRVWRGGSWYVNPRDCRSAFRDNFHPGNRYTFCGFRAART